MRRRKRERIETEREYEQKNRTERKRGQRRGSIEGRGGGVKGEGRWPRVGGGRASPGNNGSSWRPHDDHPSMPNPALHDSVTLQQCGTLVINVFWQLCYCLMTIFIYLSI